MEQVIILIATGCALFALFVWIMHRSLTNSGEKGPQKIQETLQPSEQSDNPLLIWQKVQDTATSGRKEVWMLDVGWKKNGRAGYRFVRYDDNTLVVLSLQSDAAYIDRRAPSISDFQIDEIKLDSATTISVKRSFMSLTSSKGDSSGAFKGETENSGVGLTLGGGVTAHFGRGKFSGETFDEYNQRSIGEDLLVEAKLVLSSAQMPRNYEFRARAAVGDIVDCVHGEEWLLMSMGLAKYKKILKEHLHNLDEDELDESDYIDEEADKLDWIAHNFSQGNAERRND